MLYEPGINISNNDSYNKTSIFNGILLFLWRRTMSSNSILTGLSFGTSYVLHERTWKESIKQVYYKSIPEVRLKRLMSECREFHSRKEIKEVGLN